LSTLQCLVLLVLQPSGWSLRAKAAAILSNLSYDPPSNAYCYPVVSAPPHALALPHVRRRERLTGRGAGERAERAGGGAGADPHGRPHRPRHRHQPVFHPPPSR
jgi:hypothetical protein